MKIRGTTITTPIKREAVPKDTAVTKAPWSAIKVVQTFGIPINESENFVQVFPIDGTLVSVKVVKPTTATHIKLYCMGKNLYPQTADAFLGGYINQKTGNVQTAASSICSKPIPVAHLAGNTIVLTSAYVGGSNPGWAFYNADGTYMRGGNTATAVVPDDAVSFRFTVKKSNISDDGTDSGNLDYSKIQMEIGYAPTEVESYREIEFDPCDESIELEGTYLDGVNTFYAYAGSFDGDTFTPTEPVRVSVAGYGNPVKEFEKLNAEIAQLKNTIIATGAYV